MHPGWPICLGFLPFEGGPVSLWSGLKHSLGHPRSRGVSACSNSCAATVFCFQATVGLPGRKASTGCRRRGQQRRRGTLTSLNSDVRICDPRPKTYPSLWVSGGRDNCVSSSPTWRLCCSRAVGRLQEVACRPSVWHWGPCAPVCIRLCWSRIFGHEFCSGSGVLRLAGRACNEPQRPRLQEAKGLRTSVRVSALDCQIAVAPSAAPSMSWSAAPSSAPTPGRAPFGSGRLESKPALSCFDFAVSILTEAGR